MKYFEIVARLTRDAIGIPIVLLGMAITGLGCFICGGDAGGVLLKILRNKK